MMKQQGWLSLLLCLLGVIRTGHVEAGDELSKPAPPNIVLIFVDDLGYGDVEPFGGAAARTPALNQLASEGMKFTSFYATPVCSMSRACLLTGCYNVRVSVPGVYFPPDRQGLNPNELTLGKLLQSQGYATTCIGKWHLGHHPDFLPVKHGFDSWFGIPYSNDMALDVKLARFAEDCLFREGLNRETSLEKPLPNKVPLMRGLEIVEYPADQATLTERYTEEAVRFIRENESRPFFLYLPHTMVHFPLAASERFRGRSGKSLLVDAIEELDWSVSEIMKTLAELNLDERTLVIFTSDNGAAGGSSAPWRGKKASVYEGGVREPCIMRWPGQIPAGTSCHQIAGNIDLLPTFAGLVGAQLPPDLQLDGADIQTLLRDPNAGAVRTVQLYYNRDSQLAAIREGNWKLLLPLPPKDRPGREPPFANAVLYELEQDPRETTDRAAEHPELVARLTRLAEERDAEIRANQRPPGKLAE